MIQVSVDGDVFPYVFETPEMPDSTIWPQDFVSRPAPGLRTSDQSLAGFAGVVPGDDLYGDRRFTIPFLIDAIDSGTATELADILCRRFGPIGDVWLQITLDEAARNYWGRPRGVDLDDRLISQGVVLAEARFVAIDPRTFAVPVTQSGGGPYEFTLDYDSPWELRMSNSPLTSVSITNDSGSFDVATEVEVAADETLTIGTFPRRTANIDGREIPLTIGSRWGDMAGDSAQTVTVTHDGDGPTMLFTVWPVMLG